jgi:hypothetical protein
MRDAGIYCGLVIVALMLLPPPGAGIAMANPGSAWAAVIAAARPISAIVDGLGLRIDREPRVISAGAG